VIEDGRVKTAEFFGREEGEEEGKDVSGEGEEQSLLSAHHGPRGCGAGKQALFHFRVELSRQEEVWHVLFGEKNVVGWFFLSTLATAQKADRQCCGNEISFAFSFE
jgi:hypothetical protein